MKELQENYPGCRFPSGKRGLEYIPSIFLSCVRFAGQLGVILVECLSKGLEFLGARIIIGALVLVVDDVFFFL